LAKAPVEILVEEADVTVEKGNGGSSFIAKPSTHSLSMEGVAEAIGQATGLVNETALLVKVGCLRMGYHSVPSHELQGSRPKLSNSGESEC
jgi:hypothetical protein